jgi:hypothetical protein
MPRGDGTGPPGGGSTGRGRTAGMGGSRRGRMDGTRADASVPNVGRSFLMKRGHPATL